MDYRPNVDAVKWFVEEIFPKICTVVPSVKFYIVGSNPTKTVYSLANKNIYVTGYVDNIIPYILHSVAAVAPLRVARGIQNKVLEAMALGKPVIATHAAMEGIQYPKKLSCLVSDEVSTISQIAIELLRYGDRYQLGKLSKSVIHNKYSWEKNLDRYLNILDS